MKKFTKICLITSLVMILVGGSIFTITLFKGGFRLVSYVAEDIRWFDWIETAAYKYAWMHDWEDYTGDREGYTGEWREEMHDWEDNEFLSLDSADMTGEYQDTGISASEVRDLKIEIGGAAVYLAESDNDNFGVRIDGEGKYQYAEKDGAFYIKNRGKGFHAWEQPFAENEKVYLYIPKGMRFQEAEIVIGGGMAQIEALEAEEVDLEVGAGVISSEMIKCRTMNVEVGAGNAVLNGIDTSKLGMEVGMGEASVWAVVTDGIKAECGMGQISLRLGGRETDYNYDLSCSAGDINLNGKSYEGLAKEKHIRNNAPAQCELECAMGSIEVIFEESN